MIATETIATQTEYSLCEEPELDEFEFEVPACIRPQFKDACEFGRACRSLAIPVRRSEEFAAICCRGSGDRESGGWASSSGMRRFAGHKKIGLQG